MLGSVKNKTVGCRHEASSTGGHHRGDCSERLFPNWTLPAPLYFNMNLAGVKLTRLKAVVVQPLDISFLRALVLVRPPT